MKNAEKEAMHVPGDDDEVVGQSCFGGLEFFELIPRLKKEILPGV